MPIADTKPGRRRTRSGTPPTPAQRATLRGLKPGFERLPACSFCRKKSSEVTFVITDPANLNNICERCADECVRVFACTCVC